MAVVGALGGLVLLNYPASTQRARDSRRISELKQYQIALEAYANKNNGFYPPKTDYVKPSSLCSTLGMASCPDDPKDGLIVCGPYVCQYLYVSNSNATVYGLSAMLERPPGGTAEPGYQLYVVCSKGLSGYSDTNITSSDPCADLDSTTD